MIVFSLYLSKGLEIDPYLYYCEYKEFVLRYRVSPRITRTQGLCGGLHKQLYALHGGSAGSGYF